MDRETQKEPNTIDSILRKIEEKADTGEYLYRGEPEHYLETPYYGKISSNLYREFLQDDDFDVESEHFDIEELQKRLLEAAEQFSLKPVGEMERLAEIQHYGGKTNLIDFTEDYLIALFMACDGSPDKNGRFIFLEKQPINSYIEKAFEPVNRVIAQKSVFVRHPDGFIQPNEADVINIPAPLKKPMKEHLDNCHGISVKTVYNDIHGFIKDMGNHLEAYKAIHNGLNRERQGDSENG